MKRRRLSIVLIPVLVIPILILPGAAYYFDLQDFETDKLVYEVGETVNMAADLIADYGSGGWCRITFGFVSDQGPVFAEESNITPSTEVRRFNTSYLIEPDDTSPGEDGCSGFAIFTAEIYDTVSESDGRNIEVTITKGHLEVVPLSPLEVTYGMNTTINLKIASIFNHNITRSDGIASIAVMRSGVPVLEQNSTIDTEGTVSIKWNASLGAAGIYDLNIHTSSNEDFLEMNESLPVTVLPAYSNLTIIEAPSTASCKSPGGTVSETISTKVSHTDMLGSPLSGSLAWWNTTYGSGVMDEEDNGTYSASIPILFSPGHHNVTITASNSDYQPALAVLPLQILPNSLAIIVDLESSNVTTGTPLELHVTVQQQLDWNQPITLEFRDGLNEIIINETVEPGVPEAISHGIETDVSVGVHMLTTRAQSEYYSGNTSFSIVVIGIMNVQTSLENVFYGEATWFNLTALGSDNETIQSLSISALLDSEMVPFATIDVTNSTEPVSLLVPTRAVPGVHNLTLHITSEYYQQFEVLCQITVWMRTNISIIISRDSGSLLRGVLNQLKYLLRFDHATSPNFVKWNDLSSIVYNSGNLSGKLSEIQLWNDYLGNCFSEGSD